MFRYQLTAGFSVVLVSLMAPTVHAQYQDYNGYQDSNGYGSPAMSIPTQIPDQGNWQGQYPQMPPASYYQTISAQVPTQPPTPIDADLAGTGQPYAPPQQGYVRLGAPMYPTPRPNIPIWSGSTVITNQALAPQEMLYPHTYKAIYPPFYHRVKGGWVLTPFGVRSHEKWELQGTMVKVKYRSSYPGIFSGAGWHPPHTGNNIGSWR